MKKLVLVFIITGIGLFTSCSKCKECQLYTLGELTGNSKQLCGDDLKSAEENFNESLNSGFKCEE